MYPIGYNLGLWCHSLVHCLLFAPWWVPSAVIVTPCVYYMWITVSLPHSAPFPGNGSMWHLQMIAHPSLVLYFCLYCHVIPMSPPRVVHVFGVVVLDSCTNTIRHMRWLGSLGNCIYPGGYWYLNHSIYLIIVWSRLTRGGTYPGTSWCPHFRLPLRVSCLFPLESCMIISKNQPLIWLLQTSCSRLQ